MTTLTLLTVMLLAVGSQLPTSTMGAPQLSPELQGLLAQAHAANSAAKIAERRRAEADRRASTAFLHQAELLNADAIIADHNIFQLSQVVHKRSCPSEFTENNGNCFYFSSDTANWSQARNNCKRRGGDLAELGNSAQWILDQSKARKMNYWIGGSTPNGNSDWSWVSGRNLPSSYSFWHPNEPNNQGGNEFCLVTWPHGSGMLLNDARCFDARPYICKSA